MKRIIVSTYELTTSIKEEIEQLVDEQFYQTYENYPEADLYAAKAITREHMAMEIAIAVDDGLLPAELEGAVNPECTKIYDNQIVKIIDSFVEEHYWDYDWDTEI